MDEIIKMCEKVLYLCLKSLPIVLLVGFVALMCMAVTPLVVYVVKAIMYVLIPVAVLYVVYKYTTKLTAWLKSINERLDKLTKEEE